VAGARLVDRDVSPIGFDFCTDRDDTPRALLRDGKHYGVKEDVKAAAGKSLQEAFPVNLTVERTFRHQLTLKFQYGNARTPDAAWQGDMVKWGDL
jgi:hypothetical protein